MEEEAADGFWAPLSVARLGTIVYGGDKGVRTCKLEIVKTQKGRGSTVGQDKVGLWDTWREGTGGVRSVWERGIGPRAGDVGSDGDGVSQNVASGSLLRS